MLHIYPQLLLVKSLWYIIYPWSMNNLCTTRPAWYQRIRDAILPSSPWKNLRQLPVEIIPPLRWNHQCGHFYRHIPANSEHQQPTSYHKAEWDQDLKSRDLWLETCQLLYCLKTACLDIFSILVLNFSGLTLYLHSLVLSNSNGISPPLLMFCYYILKKLFELVILYICYFLVELLQPYWNRWRTPAFNLDHSLRRVDSRQWGYDAVDSQT